MPNLLHIEDSEEDRRLVRRELGRVFPGLRVDEVRNQAEFDRALDAGSFDLAVTDYQLNWGNGIIVLEVIKARHPETPVVMFTGSGNEEVAVEAMKSGLDDYVVKSPRHAIRLVTAVRSALERAEARRRAAEAEGERADLLRREREARAEAERLLAEAREAERRKDEFLAMLAHELRNPLSPIMNAVHLLRRPALPAAEGERMRTLLERQVRHLSRIVDDLLDVSRVTRGKIELRRERLDLGRLTREVSEDHRGAAEEAGVRLETHVPAEPVWVRGDATRLAQVLGNLLTNAVKFTERGGRVDVRLAEGADGFAVLEVEDTGVGIDHSLLTRVFDMFTQADQSLERSRGGLGLGLALVKGLIELHGGCVRAESAGAGRGATFSCRLPVDRTAGPGPAGRAADAPAAAAGKILVIEDSHDGAESLQLLLELSGHEVRVAYTGPSGVEAAREFRPQLILCDLGLPGGMSGFDVARTLRLDPTLAATRLIALSGYGQSEDQAQAKAAGFELHLTKPVDPSRLQRIIAESLGGIGGP